MPIVAVVTVAVALAAVVVPGRGVQSLPHPQPMFSDAQLISTGTTPPTEAQCESVGRRCFTPQTVRAAYNIESLYISGLNGLGQTIAIIDSYGSDTIAHDLHVYNQAFGLQAMCGEEGVTCAEVMQTFRRMAMQGSPATIPQQSTAGAPVKRISQLGRLRASLDVETAHAIAPMATIVL
jgi:subtilase family serine protease